LLNRYISQTDCSIVGSSKARGKMGFGFIIPLKQSVDMDFAGRFVTGTDGVFMHEGRNISYTKCEKWDGK